MPTQSDNAVIIDDVSVRFEDQLAVDGISLDVPARDHPRADRTVRCRKDDDDPRPDRGAGPDERSDRGPRRGPTHVPPADSRADRLHAAVVHAVPRPDRARERRLRRITVRDAVPLPSPANARGARIGRPVGCSEAAGRAPVGRDAAPARACLRAGPQPCPALPRRADRRDRPDPAGHDLGGAPQAPRRRPDPPRHDPVRQRSRGVRPGRPDRRRAGCSRWPRPTSCAARSSVATSSSSRPPPCSMRRRSRTCRSSVKSDRKARDG